MRISDWSSDVCSSDLQAQHFLAAALIIKEAAQEPARHHADARRAHAAPGHAAMLRVDDDRDTVRMEIVPDAARDLGGQPRLHLQPPRLAIEHARKLGNADDAVARQIGVRRLAGDRRHIMFAKRTKGTEWGMERV